MKRLFAIAAIAAGITFFSFDTQVSAYDHFGGHHGRIYNQYGQGGYGHGGAHAYAPSRGHGSHYGGTIYGSGYGYQPSYRGGYIQNRGSYSHGANYGHGGGLHLDVGRLHLGIGGHH
ncbi:hypothetical protein Q31b_31770 [Novipirellula aureliae]|uniref:Uncharacterized protein n=1 Tax=Novipirellula aureliae TaxID=2527966 RepID=A0A5C6DT54_9BACT|nr:hypothetical protein [Novipirellula aureliae]TWU39862.1 hypothetical protein Q31b_31770 [Novipirellula aureliae]